MKKIVIAMFAVAALLSSCKKDEKENPPPTPATHVFQVERTGFDMLNTVAFGVEVNGGFHAMDLVETDSTSMYYHLTDRLVVGEYIFSGDTLRPASGVNCGANMKHILITMDNAIVYEADSTSAPYVGDWYYIVP